MASFSWKLIPTASYLQGDAARHAFDAADKKGAKFYEPFTDSPAVQVITGEMNAKNLDQRLECYVIAADDTWTYIKTHEGDFCGPYFYKPVE